MLDWHVLVGIAGVSAAYLLYIVIVGLTIGSGESSTRVGAGCLLMTVGGPLVQIAAVSGFVLVCLPSIIGSGGFTPRPFIEPLLRPVFMTGFVAGLIVLLLCFIPFIGRLISNTPGVSVFLQGIFMLKPITKTLYQDVMGEGLPDSAFPSPWNSLGYVLIGMVLCWTTFMVLAFIADNIKKRTNPIDHFLDQYGSEPTNAMTLIGAIIGPAFGIVPLLMYGQYVSLMVQHLR